VALFSDVSSMSQRDATLDVAFALAPCDKSGSSTASPTAGAIARSAHPDVPVSLPWISSEVARPEDYQGDIKILVQRTGRELWGKEAESLVPQAAQRLDGISLSSTETGAPSTAELLLARRIVLASTNKENLPPHRTELCRWWVEMLLTSDRDSERLVDVVRTDRVFYDFPRGPALPDDRYSKRQPKRRQGDTGWRGGWERTLPFLKHPERLTMAELELALVIFSWQEDKPVFPQWLQLHAPDLLPCIHRFLLRRYCCELLGPFKEALAAADRFRPPYRAGEIYGVHLRMLSMIAVGLMALLGASDVLDHLAAHNTAQALLMTCLLLALVFILRYRLLSWEVFRQNHGFLASKAHAESRIVWLFTHVLAYAVIMSACANGFLFLHDVAPRLVSVVAQPPDLSRGPHTLDCLDAAGRGLLSIVVQGLLAAVLGVVLQSLWDSHSIVDAD